VEVGSCFVSESFFPSFFDCGDAEFLGFSLACFGAGGSAERVFPCVGGVSFCGADNVEGLEYLAKIEVNAKSRGKKRAKMR
jgi:hypothetical protein